MDFDPDRIEIHPTSSVAEGAILGSGVRIGPFCTVGPDVVLGDRVRLISHVVLDGHTRIGDEAVLYPFCTVGMPPQDLKYRGEPTETMVGARTQLREGCTVHRGTVTGTGRTVVGADCMLMAVVHVAHDCALGDGVIVANNVVMGGHVTIGDRAIIGGASALHQFVRIGRGAVVGGVSGVEGDVIPFGSVMGNRARLVGLNLVGLKRRNTPKPEIHRLRATFRALFRDSQNEAFAARVKRVRETMGDNPMVAEILAFIESPSRRGLIRARPGRAEEGQDEG